MASPLSPACSPLAYGWQHVSLRLQRRSSLGLQVGMVMIDEVHLLNESRGAVLEAGVVSRIKLVAAAPAMQQVSCSVLKPHMLGLVSAATQAPVFQQAIVEQVFMFQSCMLLVPMDADTLDSQGGPSQPQAAASLPSAAA